MPNRHATLPTALGDLLVVADGDGLTGIYFPGHWHPPIAGSIGEEVDARGDALFAALGAQLGEYLDGRRTEFDLPMSPAGDEFQHAVWRCSARSRTARRRRTASSRCVSATATWRGGSATRSGGTR